MISGHLQGRFLSFVSRMVKPQNILEIGTYTGYSALCLAEGLRKKGRLITIDRDKSLKEKVSKFFNKSIFKNQIDQKLGNAIDIIPKLKFNFDLIFIDADKKNYKNYFDSVLPKLNKEELLSLTMYCGVGRLLKLKNLMMTKLLNIWMNSIGI